MNKIQSLVAGVVVLLTACTVKVYGKMQRNVGYLEGATDTMKAFVEKDAEKAAEKKED